jgi:hypothetical protein
LRVIGGLPVGASIVTFPPGGENSGAVPDKSLKNQVFSVVVGS